MKARVVSREVFVPAAGKGNAYAAAFYTRRSGLDVMSVHAYETTSDVLDVAYARMSRDNGRTWSVPVEWKTMEQRSAGWMIRSFSCGFADPIADRFLMFVAEGVFPGRCLGPGKKYRSLRVMVSADGGRTFPIREPIIQEGPGFDENHPLPHIWTGKNECLIGDMGSCPISLEDGTILVPFQFSQLDEAGQAYDPHGFGHFWAGAVLRGRWLAGGNLEWQMSEPVLGDSERVTIGIFEPTLALLDGHRILMVLRGSNHTKPSLPSYKWMAVSDDSGRHWSKPEPWTYSDGSSFFSSSSMSQLLQLSSGRLIWLGNISAANGDGNNPRYPLVLGEVDRHTGLLIRDTLSVIDARAPEDDPGMSLSNFHAREDRETNEIALHIWRYAARPPVEGRVPYADSLIYRIRLRKKR